MATQNEKKKNTEQQNPAKWLKKKVVGILKFTYNYGHYVDDIRDGLI